MSLPEIKLCKIQKTCFRGIRSIKESQDLFDDLASTEYRGILQEWDNKTSGIDHGAPQKERVFQYGSGLEADVQDVQRVFASVGWGEKRPSRFTEGVSFGVWYGALSETTVIREQLYWQSRFAQNMLQYGETYKIDLRMLRAEVSSKCAADLRPLEETFPALRDPSDYTFCQALGKKAVQDGIDFYLTPSARDPEGTCVPVFTPRCLRLEGTLYYFHFTFRPDSSEVLVTRDHDEVYRIVPEVLKGTYFP